MGWNLADIKSDALRRQLRTGLETRLARSCPVIQKREAPDTRETDYRSSKAEDHGHDHRRVPRTVRLTFHIADRRRRDIDGMTSTILDCMVKAGAIPAGARRGGDHRAVGRGLSQPVNSIAPTLCYALNPGIPDEDQEAVKTAKHATASHPYARACACARASNPISNPMPSR